MNTSLRPYNLPADKGNIRFRVWFLSLLLSQLQNTSGKPLDNPLNNHNIDAALQKQMKIFSHLSAIFSRGSAKNKQVAVIGTQLSAAENEVSIVTDNEYVQL